MNMMIRARGPMLVGLGVWLMAGQLACPSHQGLRPDDPSYAAAVGEDAGGTSTAPLVVDWRPEDRGELEVAMKKGVAVVASTARGMKVLGRCELEGDYGFTGMTLKEQVVSLETSQEIRANLPLSGVGLAGSIGGEADRKTVLHVAMAMVGKKRTTRTAVARDELRGECQGATHVVRGATLGAFVMKKGTKGEAMVAAQLFGMGTQGGESSAKSVENSDGELASCRGADPEGEAPPARCAALIRLELDEILERQESEPVVSEDSTVVMAPRCGSGLYWMGGKCSVQRKTDAICHSGHTAGCGARCESGDGESCLVLGFAHERGLGVSRDIGRARALYEKACTRGVSLGCHNLGTLHAEGKVQPAQATVMNELFRKACDDGEVRGCNSLGASYFLGSGVSKDMGKAGRLFLRACRGGEPIGCTNYGSLLQMDPTARKKTSEVVSYYLRACHGNDPGGCTSLGNALEAGYGFSVDLPRAIRVYEQACVRRFGLACYSLGALMIQGKGTGKDEIRARSMFEKGCNFNDVSACSALQHVFGVKRTMTPADLDLSKASYAKSCALGDRLDCTKLGLIRLAVGDAGGRALLETTCQQGDGWACRVIGR